MWGNQYPMELESYDIIEHHGVKGMKWGVRRATKKMGKVNKKLAKTNSRIEKNKDARSKLVGNLRGGKKGNNLNRSLRKLNSLDTQSARYDNTKGKLEYKRAKLQKKIDGTPISKALKDARIKRGMATAGSIISTIAVHEMFNPGSTKAYAKAAGTVGSFAGKAAGGAAKRTASKVARNVARAATNGKVRKAGTYATSGMKAATKVVRSLN